MIIKRKKYLDMLIAGQGNGLVKIVTGGRRCGKSFLLFTLFHNYLVERGIAENHIIEVSLDDRRNRKLRDPDHLLELPLLAQTEEENVMSAAVLGTRLPQIMIDSCRQVNRLLSGSLLTWSHPAG